VTLVELQELFDLAHTYTEIKDSLLSGTPWGTLDTIERLILEIASRGARDGLLWERQSGVWVGAGAKISPDATILAPCIIGAGCEIRPNAYLRGRVILGKNCVIGNASEVKNAILFDEVKAPHFNYIGDSILGHRAHLGAGVILSNVRLDKAEIFLTWNGEGILRKKAGALVGDGAEIGCNTVVNPGIVIVREARIPPLSSVRRGGYNG
jgi:NDP-sugar pyrophosphorylase family protein